MDTITRPIPTQPTDTSAPALTLPSEDRLERDRVMSATDMQSSPPTPGPPKDVTEHLEHAFGRAHVALSSHNDGVPQPNTFALRSHAYYNLESYLGVGLSLPSTTAAFEGSFPEAQLAPLTDHDTQVYNDLEVCFVDIHQHCARFSDQSFSGFTAVSQSIVGFCDLFSRRVNGEGSLREQIAILTDETVEKSSSAYAEALEKSHIIAMELSESTRELKDQCDKLVKRLHAFLIETKTDTGRVHSLHAKLIGSGETTAYNDILLGRKVAQKQRNLFELMGKHRNHEEKHLHKHCDTPHIVSHHTTGFLVTSAVDALQHFLPGLMNALQQYHHHMGKVPAEKRTLVETYHCFAKICFSVSLIERAIDVAIKSVESYTATFGRLAQDFRQIALGLYEMDKNENSEHPVSKVARVDFDLACEKWAEIKKLSAAFASSEPRRVIPLNEAHASVTPTPRSSKSFTVRIGQRFWQSIRQLFSRPKLVNMQYE